MSVVLVLSTFPTEQVARQVARTLVEERLAACVNIVPAVRSIYRWDGAIQDEAEVLAIVKTTSACATAMRTRLVELHPNKLPEAIDVPISDGYGKYLAWVAGEVE
jgi:periplasmic divalent cation tolerance protein